MRLKESILAKIKESNICVAQLMMANDVTERTIYNWCDRDEIRLTAINNLQVIARAFSMTIEDLLEECPVDPLPHWN